MPGKQAVGRPKPRRATKKRPLSDPERSYNPRLSGRHVAQRRELRDKRRLRSDEPEPRPRRSTAGRTSGYSDFAMDDDSDTEAIDTGSILEPERVPGAPRAVPSQRLQVEVSRMVVSRPDSGQEEVVLRTDGAALCRFPAGASAQERGESILRKGAAAYAGPRRTDGEHGRVAFGRLFFFVRLLDPGCFRAQRHAAAAQRGQYERLVNDMVVLYLARGHADDLLAAGQPPLVPPAQMERLVERARELDAERRARSEPGEPLQLVRRDLFAVLDDDEADADAGEFA